jgi:hypothetical protein
MSSTRRNFIGMCAAGAASVAVITGAAYLPGAAGATTTTVAQQNTGSKGSATTTHSLTGIRARASSAVTHRVRMLETAAAHVDAERDLGDGRAQLSAYLKADIPRLQQQEHVVAVDTVVAQAQRDYADIYSGFRVFRLVLPAASLAARADRVTKDVPALKAAATKAQAAAHAQNQATVEPLVADLQRQIATATSAADGLAATVLAYTPAQLNANSGLLSPATSTISTAEGAIRTGRADVQHIRQDLHAAPGGGRAKPFLHHRGLEPVSGGR